MGRIGIIESISDKSDNSDNVTEIEIDPGGKDYTTGVLFRCPGDDSKPIAGVDYAITSSHPGDEGQAIVGFVDPLNASETAEGEVRRYSRDGSGAVAAEIYLKSDGTIVIKNASTEVSLGPSGEASISIGSASIEVDAVGKVIINNALEVLP